MQVGVDVTCIHTSFGGRDPSGFGYMAAFKKRPNFPFGAKFPFRGMDYSPWSWKNLIDRNRLKKFMQVGIDVTCMHIDFGGCGLGVVFLVSEIKLAYGP